MALLDALKNIYGNGGVGDPLIGIGMGLLSQRDAGRGVAQGFQNVAAMTELASQKKRQELQDQLLTAQAAKAMRPNYQYHTDPNSGIVSAIDPTNPNAGLMPLPNQQPAPKPHWAGQGEVPANTPFIDAKGMPHFPPAAGATVNMPQTEKAFEKQSGEDIAKRFGGLSAEGDKAQEELAMVSRLRGYGNSFDSGFLANTRNELAKIGVKLGDNVGPIEAYGALIDKMAPMQRVPGSGAQSDFELKNFKNSLPSLIKTPEGNALVMDTIEAMSKFKMDRAVIGERAQMGEISPQDALKAIRALPNPMEKFNKQFSVDAQQSGGSPAAPAPVPQQKGKTSPAPSSEMEMAREIIRLDPSKRRDVLNHFLKNGYDPSGL